MAIQEPVIPGINAGAIWAPVQKELSWLQKHERIVIVALVLSSGVFLGNKWLNYDSAQKDARVAVLTAQVAQDKVSVQNLALQAATAQAAYQTTLDAITKENQALASANAQELASLAQRQTVDKALPLPAVAQRIEVLVPDAQGGITATTSGVVMNDTASHSVLTTLEEVPVLTDELNRSTQLIANGKVVIDQANTVIADKTAQIGALNATVADQDKKFKDEVAASKAREKKAWKSGFKWGFGLGFAAGAYLVHML